MPTKKCPYCQEEIAEEARVCKFCSSSVVKKCPFCSEEISVLAKKCRHCNSDLASPAGPAPAAALPANAGPLGETRDVIVTMILIVVTCGIYWFIWMYKTANDINQHGGRETLNPTLDLVLCLVTCGIWSIVVGYKYAQALYAMQTAEGVQASDHSSACLLLGLLAIIGVPGGLIVPMILQGELNRHWELHRTGR